MKIVVTGALGHIGSKLCRELTVNFPGARVVMVDSLMTLRYCSLFELPAAGNYRFVEADVLEADLEALFEGAAVVIHLAAITDAANSFANRDQVETVNFTATRRVAQCCSKLGLPMIHLSSTSVYGTQNEVVDEDCTPEELQPQSPYAESKLKEEEFLAELGRTGRLRYLICRFGTIAGTSPGMRFHTAVNKFCWQAVMGSPVTVWRTALHQKRPYLALDDAVRALSFIIEKGHYPNALYNVLTDNLTVNEILDDIRNYYPGLEVRYVDTEIMNQLSYEVSNRKFRELGFSFQGSIQNSIRETIAILRKAGGGL